MALLVFAVGCGVASSGINVPDSVVIWGGPFVRGSDRAEREVAYRLDETAYGHSVTRKNEWYESEFPRKMLEIQTYEITRTPITNRHYAAFVQATGHRFPDVDLNTWRSYGLIHSYKRTRRYAWLQKAPPAGREHHPVVLVSHADAQAYASWLSLKTGRRWRLPTEIEWEKAARGTEGRRFPWGDRFDPKRANSADNGPFDTMPVGSFLFGASSFGLLDAVGQVFEWTSSPPSKSRVIVKGGSWDDKGCGICRPAARHSRPAAIKHILIGFRLVREIDQPQSRGSKGELK